MKRGQFNISFGMIFSIIVIITILSVSGYFIVKFMNVSKCAEMGLFIDDFKKEIDKAWKSDIYRKTFVSNIPETIKYVCLGNIKESKEKNEIYDKLSIYGDDVNFFLYPLDNSCDLGLEKIEKIKVDGFFCSKIKEGKIRFILKKDQFENEVSVSKA